MNDTVLTTIALTGFGVAFFHAAIPTHWLPFVLTARVQRWSLARTTAITALAGTGHVAATALLGLAMTWLGLRLNISASAWFGRVAAGILFAAAIYYSIRQVRGHGHVHFNYPHEHLDDGIIAPVAPPRVSDRAAIWSLFAFLTVSPCEAFLPIYASGIRYGWRGFVALTIILSIGTVIGMIVFTTSTLAGLNRFRLEWMEKYESGTIAALLVLVALFVLFLER
jgi:nickel/cobalt transporter (NicO) family protein